MYRLIFLIIVFLSVLNPQQISSAKTILGMMYEKSTHDPISNGVVMILDNKNLYDLYVTDKLGQFHFEDIPLSKFYMRTYRYGYVDIDVGPFSFKNNDTLLVHFEVEPEPIETDSVMIEAERADDYLNNVGFYERKEKDLGFYITEQDIQKQSAHHMADLLRTLPGMSVFTKGEQAYSYHVYSSRYLNYTTELHIFVDGILTNQGILDVLSPTQIRAVEVYPSSISAPAEYAGTWRSGGIILIWTKH